MSDKPVLPRPPSGPVRRPSGQTVLSPLVGECLSRVAKTVDAAVEGKRAELELAIGSACISAYDQGKRAQTRALGALVQAYLALAHRAYAEALHQARPGLEVPRPAIAAALVAAEAAQHASPSAALSPQEALDVLRQLGLPVAEDIPDI